jgi:ABC-type sugar transport system ATPase subunit
MGNESYIYFSLAEAKLIARTAQLSSNRRYLMGDTLKFHFMLEHCHLFDVDTEENIGL